MNLIREVVKVFMFLLNNGDTYDGEWKDSKMHGYGEYRSTDDGSIYRGQYIAGKKEGKGIIYFHDQSVYDGEWKDDNANGVGTKTYIDGTKYHGEWKDNNRHGKGEEYHLGDDMILTGEWNNDKFIA